MGSDLGTGFTEFSFHDTMPFVGGGGTLFYGRFYVDLYAQKAFDGEDEDTLDQIGRGGEAQFTSNDVRRDWDREEYSISFGYAVTDNFSFFAGYRRSDTDFDEQNVLDLRNEAMEIRTFGSTLDYEQDGPFVGGKYGWRIGDIGTIALHLGVAFLEGEIGQEVEGEPAGDFAGDTVGTTAGLSWTAPLPVLENLNYSIGVDGYQFNYDADSELNPDFSETVVRGTAGITYAFDFL